MEYFLGSIITVLVMMFVSYKFSKQIKPPKKVKINFSQSRMVELTKDYLKKLYLPQERNINKQSFNHAKGKLVRIIFIGEDAYWVEAGKLVTAKTFNKKIDLSSKKDVDTMSMDKVELDKMIFIVEKLTGGNTNDNRNSGNK